uniref:Uncharacterized protein n=1 Tax=Anguilla anguilla TaxID=7936 RepID=A0A0E9XJ33_ANGAN
MGTLNCQKLRSRKSVLRGARRLGESALAHRWEFCNGVPNS